MSRTTTKAIIQSIAIGLAPLWFPFLLAWFHTWNRLSFQECLQGERWEDHVTLVCHLRQQHLLPSTTADGSIRRIILPRVTVPTLLEWSDLFASSSESPSPSYEDARNPRITVTLVAPSRTEPSSSLASITTTTTTGYGFRRNHSHRSQNPTQPLQKRWLFPITTALVLLVNLGFFVGLWSGRVDPSRVALHSTFHHYYHNHHNLPTDLGTALTGHLSHFEIWHFGFNMMTWLTVGPTLETTISTMTTMHPARHDSFSTIPLLLWTCSFLPITSMVVWGIQNLSSRIQQRNTPMTTTTTSTTTTTNNIHSTINAPPLQPSASSSSMVGFSGILFAWLVIKTLGDGPNAMSCPVFFLPNLCFPTYHNRIFHINIGPLVQLIVLQMVLPKVSWKGHLAGILVGFVCYHATYWTSASSLHLLEFMQPSVLFPILWILGHVITGRMAATSHQRIASTGTVANGIWRNGGGSGGTWGRSRRQQQQHQQLHTTTSETIVATVEAVTGRLIVARNLLIFHFAVCHVGAWVGGGIGGLGARSGGGLSSVLNLTVLQLVIYHGTSASRGQPSHDEPLEEGKSALDTTALGVTARAYVGLSYVLLATDGLTMGNWIPTWSLWSNTGSAVGMILSRDFILLLSIGSILTGGLERIDVSLSMEEEAAAPGTWWMIVYPVARHSRVVGKSCLPFFPVRARGPVRSSSLDCPRVWNLFMTIFPWRRRTIQEERIPSRRKENDGGGNEMYMDGEKRLPRPENGTNGEIIALLV